MKDHCEVLYQSMQKELEQYRQIHLPAVQEIECCYQIVNQYWQRLRNLVSNHEFRNEREEIRFYKHCKPRFVAEIIYFELCYLLELFEPDNPEGRKNLLLRERNRLSKFVWTHLDFYEYYKSGSRAKDRMYFLRCHKRHPHSRNHEKDIEERTSTSHDNLVAQILALERYDQLLDQKLISLDRGS